LVVEMAITPRSVGGTESAQILCRTEAPADG
jgi:hypothetical protein